MRLVDEMAQMCGNGEETEHGEDSLNSRTGRTNRVQLQPWNC